MENRHYIYKGPVWNTFNTLIDKEWYGETTAPSREKAISNLKHQFRKEQGTIYYSRIYFDLSNLTCSTPVKITNTPDDILVESEEVSYEQLKLWS